MTTRADGAVLGPVGSWHEVGRATAAASASVDFTLPTGYDEYLVRFWGVKPASDNVLSMRTSADGGATFDAGVSDYLGFYQQPDVQLYPLGIAAAKAQIELTADNMAATTNFPAFGQIEIFSPASAAYCAVNYSITYYDTVRSSQFRAQGGGWRQSAAAVNAIRLKTVTGVNIATGTFVLFARNK